MFRDTPKPVRTPSTETVSSQVSSVHEADTEYRDVEAELVMVGEQSCARILGYVTESTEWWDSVSHLDIGGQDPVLVHTKHLAGLSAKLFMLSFLLHGQSLDHLHAHLVDVVTRAEADDNVESAEKLFVSRQPNQDLLTVARTISRPQVGGLVQRREVMAVSLEKRLDNGGLVVAV